MSQFDEEQLERCDESVAFVLNDPGMSAWLKDAIRAALDRHPLEVLNDLEILNTILRSRSEALIALGQSAPYTG
jgi:hypothetical protein